MEEQTVKTLLLFSLASILFSCGEPKFVRKEINTNDLDVKWCFYSYLTNDSPDIIEVTTSDSIAEVFRAEDAITDVVLESNTLHIKLFEPYRGGVFTKPLPTEIFGYRIVFDTASTYEEYANRPRGKREQSFFH